MFMKFVRELLRIVLGATFIFSGFVKGIDPLGSTYKFIDYFSSFGAQWANKLAFSFAILLSVTEFSIGIALFLKYRVRIFAWLVLIFMGFFLPLTLWIALKNPVTDCGCFGDALIISNWETFYKNIILTLLAVFVFIYRKKFRNNYNIHFQNGYFILLILFFGFLQHRSYNHLPMIDFRPYKIGNNIIEGMQIPEDAPLDKYRTNFIYRNKKTGKEKKFNESNYPWQDTINWEYVDSKSILVKEGYHAPIHDFTIENSYGENVTEFYLLDSNYSFILVAYNLDKSHTRKQERINELAQQAIENGMNFICLTASTQEQVDEFVQENEPPYEFFFCDEITLKTIIRSNPGLLLTKEGTILNKWHWKDIPKFEKLKL